MNFVLQILYLILANSSRFIIPILFLPLSARLLSNSDFEALSITISFATWVAIVIEFGFNYSSAKQIKYDSNKVKVISVINSTLSAKIILSLLAIILGIYTSFYVGKTHFIYVLLFWLYSFFVGGMLSFVYICQNNNKQLLKVELIGGVAFLLMIFVLWFSNIKNFYVIFVILVAYRCMVFLLSIFFLKNKVDLSKIRLKLSSGINAIKKTYSYALFQISSSIYLYGLSLIASIVIDKNIIIYHLLAERVFKLASFFFSQATRVIYSFLNNFTGNNKNIIVVFFCSFAVCLGIIGLIFIKTLSFIVIEIFYGKEFIAAHLNLDILAIALPFAFLNGIMSVSGFLTKENIKYLNVTIIIAGCVSIPVCYFLSSSYPQISTSIAYVVAEGLISLILLIKFVPELLKENKYESREDNIK